MSIEAEDRLMSKGNSKKGDKKNNSSPYPPVPNPYVTREENQREHKDSRSFFLTILSVFVGTAALICGVIYFAVKFGLEAEFKGRDIAEKARIEKQEFIEKIRDEKLDTIIQRIGKIETQLDKIGNRLNK